MTRWQSPRWGSTQVLLAVVSAILPALWPGHATAQGPRTVYLMLTPRPWDKAAKLEAKPGYAFRPNLIQEVLTTVVNKDDKEHVVDVKFLIGQRELDTISNVKIPPGDPSGTFIAWPPPANPTNKAPGLAEVPPGELKLRLVDKTDPKTNPDQDVALVWSRPRDYLQGTLTFYPGKASGSNELLVAVEAVKGKEQFQGPPCRLELFLDPDIKNLRKGQAGRRGAPAFLRPDSQVELSVDDLAFEGGEGEGFVFVRADGYDRALAFATTFTATGTPKPGTPYTKPYLKIRAPKYADSRKPVHVDIEADNLKGQELALEVLAPPSKRDGAPKEPPATQDARFSGEREIHWWWGRGGPQGGLLLRPELKDWSTDFDLSGRVGRVDLRLRLANEKPKADDPHAVITLLNAPPDSDSLTLAVDPKTKPIRGKMVKLIATAKPGSAVEEVIFFPGRAKDDGSIPPDTPKVPGKLEVKKDVSEWTAEMKIPADAKGPMIVSARFVNAANLAAVREKEIEVGDPEGKKRSIAGVVMEGDRAQKKLDVYLRDATGKVLDKATTGDDGKFAFPDVKPGTYRLYVAKTASSRKAEKQVVVSEKFASKEDEEKEDKKNNSLELKLYR
jgi:hypothetical protein